LLLRKKYGAANVITSDVRTPPEKLASEGPFRYVDVTNYNSISRVLILNEDLGVLLDSKRLYLKSFFFS
jgi:hypothetical protein